MGIRLLRTFLSLTPAQLGHSFSHKILHGLCDGNSLTFDLDGIIGRGGFATVFEASLKEGELGSSNSTKFVLKMPTTTVTEPARLRSSPEEQMKRECNMLRTLKKRIPFATTAATFNTSSSSSSSSAQLLTESGGVGHFPSLLFENWECTNDQIYIPMTPIGVPLVRYASIIGSANRDRMAETLRLHLTESLSVAHSLGYCYCDLRPDNVVFNPVKNDFMIIDWGLACAAGSNFHGYTGGLAYFHDDIVRLLSEGVVTVKASSSAIPYIPEYDMASALYVVYAFQLGQKNLRVPWQDMGGDMLIECRTEKVEEMM